MGEQPGLTSSEQITQMIAELADWRGELLSQFRQIISEAGPELTEDWKWNTPVWTYKGNVVSFGAFKDHVKLNFFHGAQLADPEGLFNAGLEARSSRGIDIGDGDRINESGIKELVRQAAALNAKSKKPKGK